MKYKLFIILIVILFISGCVKSNEKIAYTCKIDDFAPTYTSALTYTIKTFDNNSISSIESTAIYSATYDDTNFDDVILALKREKEKYEKEYTDAKVEFDEKDYQLFFNVYIPINEYNLEKFKTADSSLLENNTLSTTKYKQYLEKNGYMCN